MKLPMSIQKEIDAAYLRTGEYMRLEKATLRIISMLEMGPHAAEIYMAKMYKEMP